MILYSYFRSSASYRVRIALQVKGLQYEYRPIHLIKGGGEQKSAEYLKMNPQGHVPFLIDQGFGIGESVAIIDYLDNVYPKVRLFPADPRDRARVLRICEHINSGMQPFQNTKIQNWLGERSQGDQKLKEDFVHTWLTSGLKALEQMVSESAGLYSFGSTVTAADAFVVPQIFSARRFGVETSPYPVLTGIFNECEKLQAFKNAHPMAQPDAE